MPIRDIITRQFHLFEGLRSIEEDNRILERMYGHCVIELLVLLDRLLPLHSRRSLQKAVGDIAMSGATGTDRSTQLLGACLHELQYTSPETSAFVEKRVRSLVRKEFAYAAAHV